MTIETLDSRDRKYREDKLSALRRIARSVRPSLVNRGLLVGLVLVALDSLAVARLQVESALAIIRYTPPLTLLVGVVLNLGPVLATYFIVFMLVVVVARGAQGELDGAVAAGCGAVGAFYLSNAFFGSAFAWSLNEMIIWSVVVLLGAVGLSKAIKDGLADENLPYGVLILGTVAVFFSVFQDPAVRERIAMPYLPPERIEVADRSGDSFTGYVLDVDQSGQWTTILLEGSRQVVVFPSGEVRSRTLCTMSTEAERAPPRWPIVPVMRGQLDGC